MDRYVGDSYRKNPLSFTDGGWDVKVVMRGGRALIYSKVKFPEKFIAKTMKNSDVSFCKVLGRTSEDAQ